MRGETGAYNDGTIKTIANHTTVHFTYSPPYNSCYLVNETDVAQIGSTKYQQLSDAIEDANENNIIELLADNYLFYPLVVSSEKNVTIHTNSFDIITSNPITNNGKLIITNNNSNSSKPTFDYHGIEYFITNNLGATLELNNIAIDAAYAIENMGNLTINNTSITSSNIAIKNSGNITGNNNVISGSEYATYINGGESSLSTIAITGKVYINSGKTSFTGGTIARSGTRDNISGTLAINADGEMNLDRIQAVYDFDCYAGSSVSSVYCYPINNAGILNFKDSSINEILNDRTNGNIYTINNSGNATFEGTNIVLDASASTTRPYSARIINNTSGNVTIISGNFSVSDKTVYGIYNDTGTVTIGVPEPTDSIHYGKDTADVSTTNPDIKAIGTSTGIGIKNNTGKVYFYDGKITGTTSSLAEEPTGAEYLYHPCTFTDTTATPATHYTILKWMRDGQANCGD